MENTFPASAAVRVVRRLDTEIRGMLGGHPVEEGHVPQDESSGIRKKSRLIEYHSKKNKNIDMNCISVGKCVCAVISCKEPNISSNSKAR